MRTLVLVMLLAVVTLAFWGAAPARADAFYDDLKPLLDVAGGGLYYVHGRDATGIGPGLDWQLIGSCEVMRFNLIGAHSSKGHDRIIPGVGFKVRGNNLPDLNLGVCLLPSEYGLSRIGPMKAYLGGYLGLNARF